MFSPAASIAGGTCPAILPPLWMQGWWAVGANLSRYCNAISAPQGPTGTVLRLKQLCLSVPRGDFWAQILHGVGRSKVSCLDSGGEGEAFPCTQRGHPQGEARAACVHSSWPGSQPPSASGAHRFLEPSMPVMSRVEHEIPCLADTISITSKTSKSGMVASTCRPEMWKQRSGSFSATQ